MSELIFGYTFSNMVFPIWFVGMKNGSKSARPPEKYAQINKQMKSAHLYARNRSASVSPAEALEDKKKKSQKISVTRTGCRN